MRRETGLSFFAHFVRSLIIKWIIEVFHQETLTKQVQCVLNPSIIPKVVEVYSEQRMTSTRRMIPLCLILFQLFFINTILCFASQASGFPSEEAVTIANDYFHVVIGTFTNKTRHSDYTIYVFNVSQDLMQSLNSTEFYLIVDGGSEIAVIPSTSFFLGNEYILFFDEIDDRNTIIGTDYAYTLSDQVNSNDIDTIRKIQKIRDIMVGGVVAVDEAGTVAVPAEDARKKPMFSTIDQERLLVSFSLFSIAGIIIIFLLWRASNWYNNH